MLEATNDVLLRDDSDRFTTIGIIRLRQHDVTWAATLGTGGHPLPLLKRGGGSVTEVGSFGSLVGVLDTVTFSHTELTLGRGDTIVLYTDGVTEGRCEEEFYGDARLASLLARTDGAAQQLADAVVDDVVRFQRDSPRDDVAVVVIAVPPR